MLGRALAVLLILAPCAGRRGRALGARAEPSARAPPACAPERRTGGVAAVAWQSPAGVRIRPHTPAAWQPAVTAAGAADSIWR